MLIMDVWLCVHPRKLCVSRMHKLQGVKQINKKDFTGICHFLAHARNKILANKWQTIRHFSSKVGHTTPKTPQTYDGVWRSNPSSYRKGNSQSVLLFLCWGSIGHLNLWRNITHLGSRARKISLDDKNMWYFKIAWSICRAKQFLNTSSLGFYWAKLTYLVPSHQ